MYTYEQSPVFDDMEYLNMLDIIEGFQTQKFPDDSAKIADTCNSVIIEGNSLSAEDITIYLKENVTIRNKPTKDYLQAKNYKYALDHISAYVLDKYAPLTEEFIKKIHGILTDGEIDESGIYRDNFVSIRGTDFVPPPYTDVPELMAECVKIYNLPLKTGETKFEKICEFKKNFERIHPFFDGNGRTGRFIMNVELLKNNYPFITIPAEMRTVYFDSIDNNTLTRFLAERAVETINILESKRRPGENDFQR